MVLINIDSHNLTHIKFGRLENLVDHMEKMRKLKLDVSRDFSDGRLMSHVEKIQDE